MGLDEPWCSLALIQSPEGRKNMSFGFKIQLLKLDIHNKEFLPRSSWNLKLKISQHKYLFFLAIVAMICN